MFPGGKWAANAANVIRGEGVKNCLVSPLEQRGLGLFSFGPEETSIE